MKLLVNHRVEIHVEPDRTTLGDFSIREGMLVEVDRRSKPSHRPPPHPETPLPPHMFKVEIEVLASIHRPAPVFNVAAAPSTTIAQLVKSLIWEIQKQRNGPGPDPEDTVLVMNGEQLKDEHTVADYSIRSGTRLSAASRKRLQKFGHHN